MRACNGRARTWRCSGHATLRRDNAIWYTTLVTLSGFHSGPGHRWPHDPCGRGCVLHRDAVRGQCPLLRTTIRKIPPHVTEPGWAHDGHHRGGSTLPQRACNGVARNWRGFHHATPFTATGVEGSSFHVSREPHCGPDTRNLTFRADVTALCTTARCVLQLTGLPRNVVLFGQTGDCAQ